MKVKTKAHHRGGRVKTNDPLRRRTGIYGEDKINDHHSGGMSNLGEERSLGVWAIRGKTKDHLGRRMGI